ncbi:hypothetical protein CPB83DRAFT_849580 [Crepidotus variabilis]|uniref:Uncharacterized protein n=1 Tax=Crepidotus variabilis TaxID=179855 RepID=A0A9P6EK41_9AGAR|nr:hypothetical protein CPB83DRAFT_849580 [Crepidotus variabilis]
MFHLSGIALKTSLVRSIAFCLELETIRLMDVSQQFVCVDKILSLPSLKRLSLHIPDGTDFELKNATFRPSITALEIPGSSSIVYSTLLGLKYGEELEKLTINITSCNPGTSVNDVILDTLVPLVTASSNTLKELKFIAESGGESENLAEGTVAAFGRCVGLHTLQLDTSLIFNFSKQFRGFPEFSPLTHRCLPCNNPSNALSNCELWLLARAASSQNAA